MAVAKINLICHAQNRRSLQKAKQFAQAKIALSTQCKAKTKRRQNIAPSTPSVEKPQHCIFDEICQFFVSIAVAKSKTICNTQKSQRHTTLRKQTCCGYAWQIATTFSNVQFSRHSAPHETTPTRFNEIDRVVEQWLPRTTTPLPHTKVATRLQMQAKLCRQNFAGNNTACTTAF